MNHDHDAPADTRIMGIVHDALRRDLERALTALAIAPPDAQRVALGNHVEWMMDFLHRHHRGEDAGLWPLVRARDPRVGAVLDVMEADHRVVSPLVDECTSAARRYATSAADDARVALVEALVRLSNSLLPHLRREEDEVLPAVSVTLSAAEWRTVDHEYFIKGKSLAELGFEGHWLLDGLDAERAEIVVHQVPPVPRFVLVHGFAGRYHRHAIACWGDRGGHAYRPAAKLPRRVPRHGHAETVVETSIDDVWRVVRDVTRVPEWSRECRHVEWADGATEAAPGARFRGTNRAGAFTWSRLNEVVAVDAPHLFVWRTVPTPRYPDSSEWRIELAPVEGGTRIAESYEVLRAPKVLSYLYSVLVPSHRDRSRELVDDLKRLGEVAQLRTRRPGAPTRAGPRARAGSRA
jgi:hemerythrin-like domain-containing protein